MPSARGRRAATSRPHRALRYRLSFDYRWKVVEEYQLNYETPASFKLPCHCGALRGALRGSGGGDERNVRAQHPPALASMWRQDAATHWWMHSTTRERWGTMRELGTI